LSSSWRPDAGVTGFAVNHGGGVLACEAIDAFFRPLIEGKSPFDSTLIWEQMYRAQIPWDQGGVAYMAISAVDLAVWDLKAELLGKPVYDLIGGRVRDAIPCYVTTFPSVMAAFADQGFVGVKLQVQHGPADPDGINNVVALAREGFRTRPASTRTTSRNLTSRRGCTGSRDHR
jgi:L-alanine-DL-glutamate epimerase-like enolase superfamily enzyme